LADVHVTKNAKYPKGMDSFFGNIYLPENVERVVARINDRREGRRRNGKLLSSLAWLTPDYDLWGRGDSFSMAVAQFENVLKIGGSKDSLYLLANAEEGLENMVISRFRVPHLSELHFSRPELNSGPLMGGRVELMLYPTGFVIAVYHLSLPSNSGLWVPMGFINVLWQDGDMVAEPSFHRKMIGLSQCHLRTGVCSCNIAV
jgi:hypothetical protein